MMEWFGLFFALALLCVVIVQVVCVHRLEAVREDQEALRFELSALVDALHNSHQDVEHNTRKLTALEGRLEGMTAHPKDGATVKYLGTEVRW